MRRSIGVLVTAVLGITAIAVPSGASPSVRVENKTYEFGDQLGVSVLGPTVAGAIFEGGPHRFVEFEIEDSSGQPVLAHIVQDDNVDTFCGSTTEPIPITPGFDITVDLFIGRCIDGTPSVITSGTITATFLPGNPWTGNERSLSRPYSAAAPGPYFGFDPPLPGNVNVTNVNVPVGRHRFVSLTLEDASGSAIAGVLTQGEAEIARFCSETSKPIRIRPWEEIQVYIYAGTCKDGSPSTPTTGVINAVFTTSR